MCTHSHSLIEGRGISTTALNVIEQKKGQCRGPGICTQCHRNISTIAYQIEHPVRLKATSLACDFQVTRHLSILLFCTCFFDYRFFAAGNYWVWRRYHRAHCPSQRSILAQPPGAPCCWHRVGRFRGHWAQASLAQANVHSCPFAYHQCQRWWITLSKLVRCSNSM